MSGVRERCAGALVAVAATVALAATSGWAAQSGTEIFALADAATSIAWGRVTKVEAYRDGRLQVFTIAPERVLAGELSVGEPFTLVQERLFEASEPYFTRGARTLVFAKPLPNYDLYRESLPEGSYLQWAARLDTSVDLASLASPALVEPVAGYLAARADPEALARHLAGLTTSPMPRLRTGALAVIAERPDLAPLLDAAALAGLPAFLANERVPLAARGDTLVKLARAKAPGVGAIAEDVAARGGPLRPAAVDALVTLDRLPPEERLLVYSRSDDEALRLAAVRGLVKRGSPEALERVEAVIGADSEAVWRAAIRALGSSAGERVVAILERLVGGEDAPKAIAAATSLGHEGSDAAITALERAFVERPYQIKLAAAFALRDSRRGHQFLLKHRRTTKDHEIERICKLALGEDLHEH